MYSIRQDRIFRIEEFDLSTMKVSGGQRVRPYRDKVLTLLDLNSVVFKSGQAPLFADRVRALVVELNNGCFIGFSVKAVLDIATVMGEPILSEHKQFGIEGNYLLNDQIITHLNLEQLLSKPETGLVEVETTFANDSLGMTEWAA